jgi:hypothetical protein
MNVLTASVSPNTLARFVEIHSMSPLERLDERIRLAKAMVGRMSDIQRVNYNIRIAKAAFLIASDLLREQD